MGVGEMQRRLVCLLFALLLLCSVVGLRNIVAMQPNGSTPHVLAIGGAPAPPPPPPING